MTKPNKNKKNHRNEPFISLLFNENIFQRFTKDSKKTNRNPQEFNIVLSLILDLTTIIPKEDDEGFLVCTKNSIESLLSPFFPYYHKTIFSRITVYL
jgi:predicted nucleic acid-binding protein